MELGKIYKGVSVDEIHVKREEDSFLVSFSFVASGTKNTGQPYLFDVSPSLD